MNQRLQRALELSEEILEDIELEKIKLSAIALKCLRLARMTDNLDSIEWLQYELGGYTNTDDGKHLITKSYLSAKNHGRKQYSKEGKECVSTELIDCLIEKVESAKKEISIYSTQGVSVSGEHASMAMSNFTNSVKNSINDLNTIIYDAQRKISILKGEYYKYALNVNIELSFSATSDSIFESYRTLVDSNLAEIITDSEEKLSAIYDRLSEDSKESWSQASDTCRKLFKCVADNLFEKLYPNYQNKTVKVKSGVEVSITGDKYLNRLYVCLDNVNNMVTKHVENTIKWIDEVHNRICKGVHEDVTYKEVQEIIIHTYICLGDIITNIEIRGNKVEN